jgi:hypothetical protein
VRGAERQARHTGFAVLADNVDRCHAMLADARESATPTSANLIEKMPQGALLFRRKVAGLDCGNEIGHEGHLF